MTPLRTLKASNMNAARRKKLEEIKADLACLLEAEQTAHDNLPESIQAGERGDKMQETSDALQNAIDELEAIDA